ncbi:MAG: MBL fold metallo-hydrolase, partial [Candidatus Hodarchaeales archaeon]
MIIIRLENIDINLVGSSSISASNDCCVYLVSSRDFSILIDAGTGSKHSINTICRNIETIEPLAQIHYILVTHAHIDHVGGLRDMKSRLPQAKIIAHSYAADIIANEDPVLSAAKLYQSTLHAVDIDIKITESCTIKHTEVEFQIIPTPGHTPGSVVGLLTIPQIEKRVLFGQDIH